MTVQLSARNATTEDLITILNDQKAHKLDVVAPATNIYSRHGALVVKGTEAEITETGVMSVDGLYRPTEIFDEGLSEKLGIPRQYLRKLRDTRPDLLDANVNGWLHGRQLRSGGQTEVIHPADDRAFLLRLFRGDDGGHGVARALLSNKYALSMDNLDMLTAVMTGIRNSGYQPVVRVSDLTERRMRVRFEFPDRTALAPGLLENYRDPFGDGGVKRAGHFDELRQRYGAHHIFQDKDAPVAYIGFDFSNSETGDGKYRLAPVIGLVRCTNGWIEQQEGIARTHLGVRMGEGVVKPSLETLRKAGELVVAETTDAVNTWLADGYLEQLIANRTEQAQVRLNTPSETVPTICAGLGFTPDEQKGILDLFVVSGQPTAGGLAQAVSAYAQTVEDADRAYEIELATIPALEAAAVR